MPFSLATSRIVCPGDASIVLPLIVKESVWSMVNSFAIRAHWPLYGNPAFCNRS